MATNLIEPTASRLENLELFLLDLRYREGRLLDVEGNKTVILNDPEYAWVVYSGVVDVFVVPIRDNEVVGTRNYLFHSGVGQLLLGIEDKKKHGLGILVSGSPGTRLLQLKVSRLRDLAAELEYSEFVGAMLDDWITALSTGISKGVIPKDYVLVKAGQAASVGEQQVAVPQKGVLWVRPLNGHSQFLDKPTLKFEANGHFLPLSKQTWLRSTAPVEMEVIDTGTFIKNDSRWSSLDSFHQLILDTITVNRQQDLADERARLREKAVAEQGVMEKALYRLQSPIAGEREAVFADIIDNQNSLLAASQLVGKALGIHIQVNAKASADQTLGELFKSIARTSRIRTREVSLQGEWWRSDSGPILAFIADNQRAVALLPTGPAAYELQDPIGRERRPVTPEVAATLLPYGFTFYRPFPDRPLNAWDLVKYGSKDAIFDIRVIFILAAMISLLGLLPPIATGWIFDTIIPEANSSALIQVGIGLFLVALSGGLFQFTRGLAMLRAQTKMDVSIQAALWDRLLSLPTPFFRLYSAGDLASRAMGISTIRRLLSGYLIDTILTSLFSVFNLVLLFVYSPQLALVALGLVTISTIITVIACNLFLYYQRLFFDIQGEVSGTVLQLLTGIVKFRVAGAENQAFSLWADSFSKQKRLTYQGRILTNNLRAFNAAYPLLATLILFAVIAYSDDMELSTGDFLAFYAAFVQFLAAWFVLGTVILQALAVVPLYERLRPILQALPEIDEDKVDPGKLAGGIEVSHISFRYKENTPLILRDVSLSIKPGEFVALVGSSGSGKSTLFRLLLGFEKPELGGIYYDDQDLDDLDVRQVREQIGVVLQNASLMSGDIYSNIVGSSPDLTVDDAWEAARRAGLDQDIQEMPMGMHTVVSERGGTFSGGQRQRLLIARALVNKPLILFFDEATSALDNKTQEIVSKSLEELQTTRVVIAHRLSTIINADRIYVLEDGQVIQSGTYGELIKQPGLFAELAKRQVV